MKVVETIKDGKPVYQLGSATPATPAGNCAVDTPCGKGLENAQPFHPIDQRRRRMRENREFPGKKR